MDPESTDAWHHAEQCEQRRFEEEQGMWADPVSDKAPYTHEKPKMKTSEMIQSKFLKKEDFDTPRILTIKDCSLEEVGQGDTRWILFFKEVPKGLVLNVTKIRQLETAYGDDTDAWANQKVRLSHDPNVSFQGKIVGGIALQTPKAAKPAPPPPPAAGADFDDDIPF